MSYYTSHKQMRKLAVGIVTLLMVGSSQVMASQSDGYSKANASVSSRERDSSAEDTFTTQTPIFALADQTATVKEWLDKGFLNRDKYGDPAADYTIKQNTVMDISKVNKTPEDEFNVQCIAGVYWNCDHGFVDMTGHSLTLNAAGNSSIERHHIYSENKLVMKNIKELILKGENGSPKNYILIKGKNTGSIDISNGDQDATLKVGDNDKDEQAKTLITIDAFKGDNDNPTANTFFKLKGTLESEAKNATLAEIKNGSVSLDGVKFITKGDGILSVHVKDGGIFNANSSFVGNELKANEKKRDVIIKGNMLADGTAKGESGKIGLALNNSNSHFTGLIGVKKGEAHMILSDGAKWNHMSEGMAMNDITSSHLTSFYGDKGVIQQNTSKEIIIDQYSGNTTVVYAHKNQGLEAEDYIGGDIRIGKFKEGSVITVSTSNENIDDYSKRIRTILEKKIQVKGDLDIEVKASEGLLTAPRNFFTLFIDRSALQEDSTEDPNIPDFRLSLEGRRTKIGRSGLTDAKVDRNLYFGAEKANLQEYPEQKDFTIRIRNEKQNVLMGEEGGNEIYGGVGIMAKEKNVSVDMTSNNCEIEVLPHPMNQNIYGILAKNNKIVHMSSDIPSPDYLGGNEEEWEFYLKNKNKTTLSLDNSQDDSGNVYGIRAESGKIRIDANVEIIKAATKK